MAKLGAPIVEFESDKLSLEDVFLQLTKDDVSADEYQVNEQEDIEDTQLSEEKVDNEGTMKEQVHSANDEQSQQKEEG